MTTICTCPVEGELWLDRARRSDNHAAPRGDGMSTAGAEVEAIARAICVAQNGDPDEYEGGTTPAWRDYERESAAALAAAMPLIRERLAQEVEAAARLPIPPFVEYEDGLLAAARKIRGDAS